MPIGSEVALWPCFTVSVQKVHGRSGAHRFCGERPERRRCTMIWVVGIACFVLLVSSAIASTVAGDAAGGAPDICRLARCRSPRGWQAVISRSGIFRNPGASSAAAGRQLTDVLAPGCVRWRPLCPGRDSRYEDPQPADPPEGRIASAVIAIRYETRDLLT
jgi:hypothetical protein